MRKAYFIKALSLLFVCCSITVFSRAQNPVFVDDQGVIRWTKDKKEASFFGVNYTVPFAYGYRSHKALGKDIKKAIDEDVYHMSRLGLDAFRVHMWDVEITDSLGNLLQNEHLDLFDYLLYKLAERKIYCLITPIAFWGNGYPERDEKTPGFSTVYGKAPSVVKEEAIRAQENYLAQLFSHVNPYTKKLYKDDPNIIAAEINNEPHHSGPKEKTTEYINRLAASIRKTGFTKPVFYNISESPWYADAVAKSKTEGHSFQWYPSGLVANHEQKGNYLPHVDRYTIPFDSVPEYRNKARMVYEFDAADITQPIMYPAMARSYRTAGFQWATQFAYDPLATAYGNTEYQTHYLNLVYTPAKAISLLIASKVFHRVPRLKSYGGYPADSSFDVFRVSYKEQLSEMNSEEEFYYSNTTRSKPKNISKLEQIAGVGNSPVVQYEGNGAYFLDKIAPGIWRLELMPDAIQVRDPFERASPKKEVVRIQWQWTKMMISGILKPGFKVLPMSSTYGKGEEKTYNIPPPILTDNTNGFQIVPGVYILHDKDVVTDEMAFKSGMFVPLKPESKELFVSHEPILEISPGKPFRLNATVVGGDLEQKISVELRTAPRWRNIEMRKDGNGHYIADLPTEALLPGILQYRILVQNEKKETVVFPGNIKGDPFAWDNTNTTTYQVIVADKKMGLEIFNGNSDRSSLVLYNPDWRKNWIRFLPSDKASQLSVTLHADTLLGSQLMAWQFYFGDKLKGRSTELSEFKTLVVKCRSANGGNAKIGLVNTDAYVFSSTLNAGTEWKEVRIALNTLQPDSLLLLPRPYPGFLPFWFKGSGMASFNIADMEKLQVVSFGEGKLNELEISSVWLEK